MYKKQSNPSLNSNHKIICMGVIRNRYTEFLTYKKKEEYKESSTNNPIKNSLINQSNIYIELSEKNSFGNNSNIYLDLFNSTNVIYEDLKSNCKIKII